MFENDAPMEGDLDWWFVVCGTIIGTIAYGIFVGFNSIPVPETKPHYEYSWVEATMTEHTNTDQNKALIERGEKDLRVYYDSNWSGGDEGYAEWSSYFNLTVSPVSGILYAVGSYTVLRYDPVHDTWDLHLSEEIH